jgi:hypothetical protein
MSEKLAIELRKAYVVERAGHTLTAKGPPGAAPEATHGHDRISLSALARAVAQPEPERLNELAAAVETGRYAVTGWELSRRLVAEHMVSTL